VDAEIGNLLRFIGGAGRGQVVRIKSNTDTKIYADFEVTPDATSRFIVEEPGWPVIVDTEPVNNDDQTAEFVTEIDTNNYRGQVLLVQALTLDGGDTESSDVTAPIREIYLFGDPPRVRTVTADTTVAFEDSTILVDSTAGPVAVTLPSGVVLRGRRVAIKKISSDSNDVTINPEPGETIDGASSVVLSVQNESLVVIFG
jgi:hypothetical protein